MTRTNIDKLWNALESDNRFRVWIEDGKLGVKFKNMGLPCTKIDPDKISPEDVDEIVRVLSFEREPIILDVMSRIVGYYSSMSSWNKSKLGEAKDRRKGDYEVAA